MIIFLNLYWKSIETLIFLILKFAFKKSHIRNFVLLYEYEFTIINVYIKIYYIFISMSLKFSYIPYKINKMIVLINLPKKYRK